MATKRNAYAVLMGDIVGSERAPSLRTVHKTFNKAIDAANQAYAASIASPLTITLGDEFQGLIDSLAHAWDIASALRLRLLVDGVACRFVIGFTELESPLNTKQAWNMLGRGLAAARDTLNDKSSGNAYRFSLPDEPLIAPLLNAVGDTLTLVERDWTATQLAYYAQTRESTRSNAALAKKLGVTPRSLYKVLRAARADLHARQSGVVRATLQSLDEKYALS